LALFALAFRKNQAPPVAFQTTEQDSEWIENNELRDNAKEKFSAKVGITKDHQHETIHVRGDADEMLDLRRS
jgi:hypothetical protein